MQTTTTEPTVTQPPRALPEAEATATDERAEQREIDETTHARIWRTEGEILEARAIRI